MKHPNLTCLLVLTAGACGDPLVDPQTVIGLRTLGAKLTADDDATAAEVAPGKSATLSWLVVAEKKRDYHALSLFCKAKAGSFGVPQCGTRFEKIAAEGSTSTPLVVPFTLPSDLRDAQEWLSFLAVCEQGEPRWNENNQRFSCTSDEQPVVSVYNGTPHKEINHNPSLHDDSLRFDGKTWLDTTDVPASCDDDSTPRVSSDEVVRIELTPQGLDSEQLSDPSYAAANAEPLTYTHVTTTAGLARAFSAIDPDSKHKTIELDFDGSEAWADVQKSRTGMLYLVVSDGRGGSDWLQRSYCLTK
jgi:hypothetical protein